jgi:hypothetical protein
VLFILTGARDLRHTGDGTALFPEMLKPEFHGIRAVIEAHSKVDRIVEEEGGEPPAAGVMLNAHPGKAWDALVRVRAADGQTSTYKIDRWD